MSYFKLRNGEKLYYEDIGSGENTFVMLHGWTSSHEIYSDAAQRLKDKARFIIYDHRGHAGSRSAKKEQVTMETITCDLDEIMTRLGLSNVTLVGWSMGACTVMNYVRMFGCCKLKQIVLCDMTPKQMNDDDWKLGMYKGQYTQEDWELDEKKSSFAQYKKFVLATVPALTKLPRPVLDFTLLKLLMKCNFKVIKSLAYSMNAQDNRGVIGKITVPLWYFYPTPGSLFSPDLEKWYRENVKSDYHSVEFPNSSHMLISENPELFASALEKLL